MRRDEGMERIILGIDPGLAHTGWGIVEQSGSRLRCVAYGCVSTTRTSELSARLMKVHDQILAVADRFQPSCVGIESVWFGNNVSAAFATGQARGAEHDGRGIHAQPDKDGGGRQRQC